MSCIFSSYLIGSFPKTVVNSKKLSNNDFVSCLNAIAWLNVGDVGSKRRISGGGSAGDGSSFWGIENVVYDSASEAGGGGGRRKFRSSGSEDCSSVSLMRSTFSAVKCFQNGGGAGKGADGSC